MPNQARNRIELHLAFAHHTEPGQYTNAFRRHENEHANRALAHDVDDFYLYIEEDVEYPHDVDPEVEEPVGWVD